MLTRLRQGTLIGPGRLAPWAESLGVAYVSPPEPIDKPSLERFLAGLAAPDLLLVDVSPAACSASSRPSGPGRARPGS